MTTLQSDELIEYLRATLAMRKDVPLKKLILDCNNDWDIDVIKSCSGLGFGDPTKISTVVKWMQSTDGVKATKNDDGYYVADFEFTEGHQQLIKLISKSRPKKKRNPKKILPGFMSARHINNQFGKCSIFKEEEKTQNAGDNVRYFNRPANEQSFVAKTPIICERFIAKIMKPLVPSRNDENIAGTNPLLKTEESVPSVNAIEKVPIKYVESEFVVRERRQDFTFKQGAAYIAELIKRKGMNMKIASIIQQSPKLPLEEVGQSVELIPEIKQNDNMNVNQVQNSKDIKIENLNDEGKIVEENRNSRWQRQNHDSRIQRECQDSRVQYEDKRKTEYWNGKNRYSRYSDNKIKKDLVHFDGSMKYTFGHFAKVPETVVKPIPETVVSNMLVVDLKSPSVCAISSVNDTKSVFVSSNQYSTVLTQTTPTQVSVNMNQELKFLDFVQAKSEINPVESVVHAHNENMVSECDTIRDSSLMKNIDTLLDQGNIDEASKSTTVLGGTNVSTKVFTINQLPAGSYTMESARKSIESMYTDNQYKNASKEQFNSNFKIDKRYINMTKALGALLKTLDMLRLGVEFEDYTIKTPVHDIKIMSVDRVVTIDKNSFKAMQVFESDYHPSVTKVLGTKWGNLPQGGLSLFKIINRCSSPQGRALMRVWFERPLVEVDKIKARQDAIHIFNQEANTEMFKTIKSNLKHIKNPDTLFKRMKEGVSLASDWEMLYKTIRSAYNIGTTMFNSRQNITIIQPLLNCFNNEIVSLISVYDEIVDFKGCERENKFVINKGICPKYDELKEKVLNLPNFLTAVASEEFQQYALDSCSVAYFPIFGYMLQIPHSVSVPDDIGLDFRFNCADVANYKSQRMIELDESLGDLRLSVCDIETDWLIKLKVFIINNIGGIYDMLKVVAIIDCIISMAIVSKELNWIRPNIVNESVISIENGRHPIAEMLCKKSYVPNSVNSGNVYSKIKLVSGPNASGKSLFLKMVASICYLAQLGCNVPATSATIGPLDTIITRMYTLDGVLDGLSTFAKDMKQIGKALNEGTGRSLILIDEFGIGTMKEVGLSLFASSLNYWINKGKQNCPHIIASSHFHSLPEYLIPNKEIVSFHTMEVTKENRSLKFLYRVIDGRISRSYANYIALKMGVSKAIVERSEEIYLEIKKGKDVCDIGKSNYDEDEINNYLYEGMRNALCNFEECKEDQDFLNFYDIIKDALEDDFDDDDCSFYTKSKMRALKNASFEDEIVPNTPVSVIGRYEDDFMNGETPSIRRSNTFEMDDDYHVSISQVNDNNENFHTSLNGNLNTNMMEDTMFEVTKLKYGSKPKAGFIESQVMSKIRTNYDGSTIECLGILERSVHFYGGQYNKVYLHPRGLVSFNEKIYFAQNGLLESNNTLISVGFSSQAEKGDVYWNSIDASHSIIDELSKIIRKHFDKEEGFIPKSALVFVWKNLASDDKKNSFKLALLSNEKDTFAFLIYDELNWIKDRNGNFIETTFNNHDEQSQEMVASKSNELNSLTSVTNYNSDGEFAFKVTNEVEDPRQIKHEEGDDYPEYDGDAEENSTTCPYNKYKDNCPNFCTTLTDFNGCTMCVCASTPSTDHDNTIGMENAVSENDINDNIEIDIQDNKNNELINTELPELSREAEIEENKFVAQNNDADNKQTEELFPLSPEEQEQDLPPVDPVFYSRDNHGSCDARKSEKICSAQASCADFVEGYCCECSENHYGNGKFCLSMSESTRVYGKLRGAINGNDMDGSELHTYVQAAGGTTYTAISNVNPNLRVSILLLNPLSSIMAWLFARTTNDGETYNGFQLTGAVFNRTITIRIADKYSVQIQQQFNGIVDEDNIATDIYIRGTLPTFGDDVKISYDPFVEEYRREHAGFVRSYGVVYANVLQNGEETKWKINSDQQINYIECVKKEFDKPTQIKINSQRITTDASTAVVRFGSLATALAGDLDAPVDACMAGNHICTGENMKCVPESSLYRCSCKTGYSPVADSKSPSGFSCIFEERSSVDGAITGGCTSHAVCHKYGECRNGQCHCRGHYVGDGIKHCGPPEQISRQTQYNCGNYNCDVNADCYPSPGGTDKECVCRSGFRGNGLLCQSMDMNSPETEIKVHSGIAESRGQNRQCEKELNCDSNARCVYDSENDKKICECSHNFEGDGHRCEPLTQSVRVPESRTSSENDVPSDINMGRDSTNDDPKRCSDSSECSSSEHCIIDDTLGYHICACLPGHRKDSDGICRPADTCAPSDRSTCNANSQCVYSDKLQAYDCECYPGFRKEGRECMPYRQETDCRNAPQLCNTNEHCVFSVNRYLCESVSERSDGDLLIGSGMTIFQRSRDVSLLGKQLVVVPRQLIVGVAFDCQSETIYWTDNSGHVIRYSSLNGTDVKMMMGDTLNSPEGIAIDWSSRNLYYADSRKKEIGVISLDGKHQKVLLKVGLMNPRAVAIDMVNHHLYYSDWHRSNPFIGRMNLDGSENQIFVSNEISLPNGLAILQARREVCWVDAGLQKLNCITMDGRSRRVVHTPLESPFGLTVHNDERFYWTDWQDNKIHSVSIYGEGPTEFQVSIFSSGKLYGITSIPNRCEGRATVCSNNNGGCGDNKICLPSHYEAKCVCPDDLEEC
uniref:MUTSd domain-containing protein n=1 Tax=Rhabditophanes sp. KR3021 TaxID=114890 RepID=A0AC35UIP2_9BILA